MGLFVAACLVYLVVAMAYLTSLANTDNVGSMMLQGDVVATNLEAMGRPLRTPTLVPPKPSDGGQSQYLAWRLGQAR
jgi:hypothetical protein